MLTGLVLAAGIALQSSAATCSPTRRSSELVTSSAGELGPDGPRALFCVYGTPDGPVVWLLSLVALDAESGRELSELAYPPDSKEGLGVLEREAVQPPRLVDLDFDGYRDVTLRAFVGTGNAGVNAWRFDPDTETFRYQPLLSGRDLEVDPSRQELTSAWTGGHAGKIYGKTTFGWVDGNAVVLRDERQDWDAERRCYDLRVSERVEGELVETTRACSPAP